MTCPKTKLKVILQYLGDSWLGKAKHRVEGVVYEYNGEEDGITRLKDVPSKAIRAKIEGSWMNQLYYILPGSTVSLLCVCAYLDRSQLISVLGKNTSHRPRPSIASK